jgi:crossover junction endodeoxyribonuclease RuvC
MTVFGIDPGSTVTGFGVVESRRGRLFLVHAGCIRTRSTEPMEDRLMRIHDGLLEALDRHPVDAVAIEAIFAHKSAESALRLGQARGVALLAAARRGFSPVSYNAGTVKRTVGAYGRADKTAVAKVVRLLLGVLPEGPGDVADALAIAITHCNHARNRTSVERPPPRVAS